MKTFIIFTMFLILATTPIVRAEKVGEHKERAKGFLEEEIRGFRDNKWGATIESCYPIKYHSTLDDGRELYINPEEELKIGGAELNVIYYLFWKGKLCGVKIIVKGKKNWDALKDATFLKFGEGCDSMFKIYTTKYFWWGEVSIMSLEYSVIKEYGSLLIVSREIHGQMDECNRQKATEDAIKGAEEGF